VADAETRDPQPVAVFRFYGKCRVVEGKSAEYYRCYDGSHQVSFSAFAYRSSRPASVFLSGDESRPDQLIKLRKMFPFSGKIDVLDAQTKTPVGLLTRSRKIFDKQERLLGRFHDPTTWKEHLAEGAVDAIGQLIFGGPDNHGGASTSSYALSVDSKTVGVLKREVLPFFPDPPSRDGPTIGGKILRTILPKKLIDPIIGVSPPLGWTLEIHDTSSIAEMNLILLGAMMTIELRRWTGG
jgi:hypothetical protein